MTKYVVLLLVLLTGIGCNKKTNERVEKTFDFDSFKESTDLITHISIDKRILTDTINKTLDGFTHEVFKIEEFDVDIAVVRSDDIKINVFNQAILFAIPLKILVTKSTIFGPISGEGEILFNVSSDIKIDESWNLTTSSKLLHHSWIKTPKLNLGVSISAKFLSDLIIKQVSPELLKNIDEAIREEVDLASAIKSILEDFEEPFQMRDQYDLWYTPKVNSIALGFFVDEAYQIKSKLNIKATNLVNTSYTKPEVSKLPPFSWIDVPKDTSQVAIIFDLNYRQINEMLESIYRGMVIEESGKRIEIMGLYIGSNNGLLSIDCQLKGDYNGSVKLEGQPYFDKEDKSLNVREIDVRFDTKNILAKGAGWLLRGRMKRELSELLHIPLQQYSNQLQEIIDLELQNYQKENYVYLYAKLGSYEISDLTFTKNQVIGKLKFNAYISGHLNDIRFFR